jgi:hypothetical protein
VASILVSAQSVLYYYICMSRSFVPSLIIKKEMCSRQSSSRVGRSHQLYLPIFHHSVSACALSLSPSLSLSAATGRPAMASPSVMRVTMEVDADGVAIIAICNPPVNALHPASKPHYSFPLPPRCFSASFPWTDPVVLSSGGSPAGTRMQSSTDSARSTARPWPATTSRPSCSPVRPHQSHSCS